MPGPRETEGTIGVLSRSPLLCALYQQGGGRLSGTTARGTEAEPLAVEDGLSPAGLYGRLLIVLLLSGSALLLLFPQGRLALQVDSSPAALGQAQPRDDQEQIIVAGFSADRLGIDEIHALAAMEDQLRSVAGVRATRSLASIRLPLASGDEIELSTLRERLLAAHGPADPQAALDARLTDPLLVGLLVSHDLRAAAIQLDLRGSADQRGEAARQLAQRVLQQNEGPLQWQLTGAPLISDAIGELILEQMALVLPSSILFFCALVLLAFRRLLVMFAALASTLLALLWTLSAAVALGWSLNLVTIVVPPLVLALGVSYGMHVIAAHADHQNLRRGLHTIRGPVAFSALTTAIGLGALSISSLESVRQFAILGVIGSSAAALAGWCALPLMLHLSSRPPVLWPPIESGLSRLAGGIVSVVVSHSRQVIAAGCGLLLLCLIGASQVVPGARYVRDLPEDMPVRQAYDRISAAFGGANSFHIELIGSAPESLLAPSVLQTIEDLQAWLLAQPEIGGVRSINDFIKRLHQDFVGGGQAQAYRLPDSSAQTKQLIYFGAPGEIYRYANRNFSRARLEIRSPLTDTPELQALMRRIEDRLDALPPGLDAALGGNSVALVQVTQSLTGGQLRSLAISGLVIFLLLSLLFASPRVGLMAMLPNALPVVAYFALLGFTGTPLSPTTALVACIVLGIAVDDTLHLLVRFNRLARELANEEEASRAAVKEVLRPITLTTLACSLGFLTLTASPFHSQMMFGLLAATTLLLAWISDLLLAPAVSARSSIVTLWDHLRLDLGGAPHKTIPLLQDMSESQARQFALNSSIRAVSAGEDLIRQGESGKDMYVVLDGQFRVWTAEEQQLAEVGRGATLGEVGHFSARRLATVTAIRDGRVLVFDSGTLERLRLRHPRIAALVYRNLNLIQARRAIDNSLGQSEMLAAEPG